MQNEHIKKDVKRSSMSSSSWKHDVTETVLKASAKHYKCRMSQLEFQLVIWCPVALHQNARFAPGVGHRFQAGHSLPEAKAAAQKVSLEHDFSWNLQTNSNITTYCNYLYYRTSKDFYLRKLFAMLGLGKSTEVWPPRAPAQQSKGSAPKPALPWARHSNMSTPIRLQSGGIRHLVASFSHYRWVISHYQSILAPAYIHTHTYGQRSKEI